MSALLALLLAAAPMNDTAVASGVAPLMTKLDSITTEIKRAAPTHFFVDTVVKHTHVCPKNGTMCTILTIRDTAITTYDTTWVYPVQKKEK